MRVDKRYVIIHIDVLLRWDTIIIGNLNYRVHQLRGYYQFYIIMINIQYTR